MIYNFSDGKAFAPDFVLFMKDKEGKEVTYQIFIELKGPQFRGNDGTFASGIDGWKEKLLIKIKDMFESKGLTKFIETKKYKVIGVPFFNQEDENKFKEELLKSL